MSNISETLDKFETIARAEVDRMEKATVSEYALDLDDVRKMELLVKVLVQLETRRDKKDAELLKGKTPEELAELAGVE